MPDKNNMNEYGYHKPSGEVEINLADMFWYVLSKWKTAILPIILLAIALGAFGAYKIVKANKAKDPQHIVDAFLKSASANDVSDDQIDAMNTAARHIAKYYEQIQIQNKFVEESPIQKIDWQNTVKMEASYLIKLEDNLSYAQVETLAKAYRTYMGSAAVSEPIAESLGYDSRYISDLLVIGYEIPQIEYNVIAGSENVQSQSTTVNVDTFTLSITAKGNSESTCKVILSGAEAGFYEARDKFSKEIAEHSFLLIQTTKAIVRDTGIRDKQLEQSIADVQYYYDQITLETHKENGEAKYTDDELDYIDAKALLYEYEAETKEKPEGSPVTDLISIKYIILGALVGLLLFIVYWAAKYVISSKITDPESIVDRYGIRTLLQRGEQKKLRGLDKLFFNRRYSGTQVLNVAEMENVIAAELKAAAAKGKIKKIIITGAYFSDQDREMASVISRKLSEEGVSVISGGPVMYSPELIEETSDADMCVLMETLERSNKGLIDKEIEFVAGYKVPIIACIMNVGL